MDVSSKETQGKGKKMINFLLSCVMLVICISVGYFVLNLLIALFFMVVALFIAIWNKITGGGNE